MLGAVLTSAFAPTAAYTRKNEQVVPLKQEEVLQEQQKGEEVSLLEQEHWVPQRRSKGKLVVTEAGLHLKLQMHSCSLEQ